MFKVNYLVILISYTCVFLEKGTLSELEKTFKIYSKVESTVSLSRYKRSFRTNHPQMTGFIFMFRKLKMKKNKCKSSFQEEWLSNELYKTWVKKVDYKNKVYCKVCINHFQCQDMV